MHAFFFSSSKILFAGQELPADDGTDKELVRNAVIVGSPHRASRVAGGYFW
jgi:hypothetical protein